MEEELSLDLLRCAKIFAEAKEIKLSTLARLAAGDWRFFENLNVPKPTFTVRKYDEVIQYFSDNWPSDKDWPANIKRPTPTSPAETEKVS